MEDDVSTHDAFIHKDRHTFRYNKKRDRILGGDGQICRLYCLTLICGEIRSNLTTCAYVSKGFNLTPVLGWSEISKPSS